MWFGWREPWRGYFGRSIGWSFRCWISFIVMLVYDVDALSSISTLKPTKPSSSTNCSFSHHLVKPHRFRVFWGRGGCILINTLYNILFGRCLLQSVLLIVIKEGFTNSSKWASSETEIRADAGCKGGGRHNQESKTMRPWKHMRCHCFLHLLFPTFEQQTLLLYSFHPTSVAV